MALEAEASGVSQAPGPPPRTDRRLSVLSGHSLQEIPLRGPKQLKQGGLLDRLFLRGVPCLGFAANGTDSMDT